MSPHLKPLSSRGFIRGWRQDYYEARRAGGEGTRGRGEGDGAGGGEEEGESLAAPGETVAFICQMLF